MKSTCKLLLSMAALAATLLPRAAFADAIAVTLNTPVQSVSTNTGGTLIFSGSLKNTSSVTEYFNGDSYSFGLSSSSYTFNDDAYVNNVLLGIISLDPGQSYTGELFRVALSSGTTGGNYVGTFNVLGGPSGDPNEQNFLGAAKFQANVTAAVTAATPEPSSFLLLGTGLLGGLGVMRRRLQN